MSGTVYLLHFERPYKHAAHYLGWTRDLEGRLAEHRAGRGSRLMAVVMAAGIGFELARTWAGDRKRERQLKKQGGASGCCPICRAEAAHRRELARLLNRGRWVFSA